MNSVKMINQLIAKKADKRYIPNWFGILIWKYFFHGTVSEYFNFEFYRLNFHTRREYWGGGGYQGTFEKMHNYDPHKQYLDCKEKFNYFFKGFCNRKWVYIPDCSYDEFVAFINNHRTFIAKSHWLSEGESVEKVFLDEKADINALYEKYYNECFLVEEVVEQHSDMASLNPNSVNTIRLATFNDKGKVSIVAASLRCGRIGKNCTDNLHGGGICAGIDIETGIVKSYGYDNDCNKYIQHPDSGVAILGFRIPNWNSVIEKGIAAHKLLPEVHWIGWDIAITPGGIEFIEGNTNQAADLIQIGNKGLHKRFWELGIRG